MYCVIAGDIIRSKELEKEVRYESTLAINQVLEQINLKYEKYILANFGIVRGDGFEGVLFSQQSAPRIVFDIIRLLYNEGVKVRISAVLDELTVISSNRNRADGQAFYTALNEIEKLRKKKSAHWFQVSFQTGTIAQPIVNSLMELLESLTFEWTDRQTEIVWNMIECSSQQSLVAQKLGVATSVIHKQLKAAHYDAFIHTWSNLEQYLICNDELTANPIEIEPDYTTYYSIGMRRNELCDYEQSVQYFLKALDLAEEKFGTNHRNLISIYNGLAESYLEQSSIKGISENIKRKLQNNAQKVIEKSFECQKTLPKTRLEYAQTLNIHGVYYIKTQNYEKALECYLEGKRIIEDIFGTESPHLSAFISNIAIIYYEKKEYDNALEFYYQALRLAEQTKKADPISYAHELYNIGLCYANLGKMDEALEKLQASLNLYESILPAKNEVVRNVHNVIESVINH